MAFSFVVVGKKKAARRRLFAVVRTRLSPGGRGLRDGGDLFDLQAVLFAQFAAGHVQTAL